MTINVSIARIKFSTNSYLLEIDGFCAVTFSVAVEFAKLVRSLAFNSARPARNQDGAN